MADNSFLSFFGHMKESPLAFSRLLFPNPFAPIGVEFDLVEQAQVSIDLIDASGSVIARILPVTTLPAGRHTCNADLSSPRGIWCALRLTARSDVGESIVTKPVRCVERSKNPSPS